jgi:hypothetical protein
MQLDFIGQLRRFEERLGNPNAAGIPDLDDAGFGCHGNYIVHTPLEVGKPTAQPEAVDDQGAARLAPRRATLDTARPSVTVVVNWMALLGK